MHVEAWFPALAGMVGPNDVAPMTAIKASEADSFIARPDPARPVVLVYGPDAGLVHERAELWCAPRSTTRPIRFR